MEACDALLPLRSPLGINRDMCVSKNLTPCIFALLIILVKKVAKNPLISLLHVVLYFTKENKQNTILSTNFLIVVVLSSTQRLTTDRE